MLRGLLCIILSMLGITIGLVTFWSVPLLGSLFWLGVCIVLGVIGCEHFFTALGRKLNGQDRQEDYSNTGEGSG